MLIDNLKIKTNKTDMVLFNVGNILNSLNNQ